MLRGLTGAGLGKLESNEQFIELAAKYGFAAVDIDALALVDSHSVDGARELLNKHGLVIGSIGLPVEWRGSEERFRADLPKLTQAAAAAAALGCTSCCTYVLPSTDLNAAHFMALATRRLRTCAQILGAYGIRLGLEFVGPHHLRTRWKHPFIWTLEETLDWIDAIGESNVGLLFDAYHWYTNGLTVADIEKLRPEQIVHVHINDAPDVPVEEVLDNGRVYPGEGVIDLAGFLQGLAKIGYKGAVSQEILMATPPTDSPESLAQRSKAGFDKVYAAAGL
ncbi:sugar phosphate isomerase/epimerase [Paenibacillus chondroitinus]|uniref:Sugar phosphate isomerase/epimerase n=1 Tax=Paenibacillus chondroitinus TaxID=59842 RepID=A0ABU6D441_9BACL|nr:MULTISPECIES: sugar phosphate isomerase/epimerase family protein [Paenibacillus]MCY9661238.1 sugar phosphate isomerase/epimerase [Paenibacillus anseongense]MEB4792493.1 sugar phosphate isomerase/epimerase [Paenibacillus chondroitinus]